MKNGKSLDSKHIFAFHSHVSIEAGGNLQPKMSSFKIHILNNNKHILTVTPGQGKLIQP